jgi:hypothetical protein
MPLVYISPLKGKSREYIRAISNGVHDATVETYNVSAGDRFQLIRQHEGDEFVLGLRGGHADIVRRSSGMMVRPGTCI